jgi:hypothetical protein
MKHSIPALRRFDGEQSSILRPLPAKSLLRRISIEPISTEYFVIFLV